MSDLSQTVHNFETLAAGKSTFTQFWNDEGALLSHRISTAPAAAQPALNLALSSFAAGASSLVGIGLTAVGPLLAETSATQAQQVVALLAAVGVPTAGPLGIAEQATVTQIITGLKAGLDRIGISISTGGVVSVAPAAPAQEPVHEG